MFSAKGFWFFLMKQIGIRVSIGLRRLLGAVEQLLRSPQPLPRERFPRSCSNALSTRCGRSTSCRPKLPSASVPLVPATFAGFKSVTLTLNGHGKEQKIDFLLSNDDKTLARMTRMDLTHDVYAERAGKMDLQGRPVRGNPDAKVTIVNYDDYECPFCSRLHSTLMQDILPQYGDKIKIVYKDYPLPMHPWAKHAANDANCLAKESPASFWEFADYVHGNQHEISGDKDLSKSFAELDRITLDLGQEERRQCRPPFRLASRTSLIPL